MELTSDQQTVNTQSTSKEVLAADLLAGLTSKQKLFVESYIDTQNPTKSAINAGYSVKTAHVIGYKLLKNAYVMPVIQELLYAKNKEHQKRLWSKSDFVGRAIDKFESDIVPETVKPQYLKIAGEGMGIIGKNGESITNNTQINVTLNYQEIEIRPSAEKIDSIKTLLA